MKNVICIDLTNYNNEKLNEVCKELSRIHSTPARNFDVNYDSLLANKKAGFAKVYIDLDSGQYIASTTKKDKDKIVYAHNLSDMLKAVDPFVLVKELKPMSVDSLLEKIGKYGIETLTSDEKNFLDNSN